jgi:hypothetical protein
MTFEVNAQGAISDSTSFANSIPFSVNQVSSPVAVGNNAVRFVTTTTATHRTSVLRFMPPCTTTRASFTLNNARLRLRFRFDGSGYLGTGKVTLGAGLQTASGGTQIETTNEATIPSGTGTWMTLEWGPLIAPHLKFLLLKITIPQTGFAGTYYVDHVEIIQDDF